MKIKNLIKVLVAVTLTIVTFTISIHYGNITKNQVTNDLEIISNFINGSFSNNDSFTVDNTLFEKDDNQNITVYSLDYNIDKVIKSIPEFSNLKGNLSISNGKLKYTLGYFSKTSNALENINYYSYKGLIAPQNTWYKGKTLKSKITEIIISNSYKETGDENEVWDASTNGDGSVKCYITNGILIINANGCDKILTNKNCSLMFSDTSNDNFTNVKTIKGLELLDTSNAVNMVGMFRNLKSLQNLDVSNFNTKNVTNTSYMFDGLKNLSGDLNLSSLDFSNVERTLAMFQFVGQDSKNPINITLPKNIGIIDDFTFNQVENYYGETFIIPKSVTTINYEHVFYNMGSNNSTFKRFIVEDGSISFKTVDDVLYDFTCERLVAIPIGKTFLDKTFEIPEGVKYLNELSFSRTQNIETIILPNSYEIVEDFSPTTYPNQTINSGNSLSVAIYHHTSVKKYEVKSDNPKYKSINGAIYSKDGLNLIAVPTKFEGALVIPDGVTKINKNAFNERSAREYYNATTKEGCHLNGITKITIPKTLSYIDDVQLELLNFLIKERNVIITIDANNPYYHITNGKIALK